MRVWRRTRKPNGEYEGHDENIDEKEFDDARLISVNPLVFRLKNGREISAYAGNDGEIGFEEYIDNSDPVLLEKLRKEREAADEEYYRKHPEEDPKNIPAPAMCRCYEIYQDIGKSRGDHVPF